MEIFFFYFNLDLHIVLKFSVDLFKEVSNSNCAPFPDTIEILLSLYAG